MKTARLAMTACPACGRRQASAVRCGCRFFDLATPPLPADEFAVDAPAPAAATAASLADGAVETKRSRDRSRVEVGAAEQVAVETLAMVHELKKRRLLGPYPRSTAVAVMPGGGIFVRCVYPRHRDVTAHGAAMHGAGWIVVERKPVIVPRMTKPGVEVLWRSQRDRACEERGAGVS